jgi:hypothetical protein
LSEEFGLPGGLVFGMRQAFGRLWWIGG